MGFLSRKSKSSPAPTQLAEEAPARDDAHPMEDELKEMERAVPEPESPATTDAAAAGPDAAAPPAGPGREAEEPAVDGEALREADDDHDLTSSEKASRPAETAKDAEDDEPDRYSAKELIAPSRHDEPEDEAKADAPVKHADVIAFANQKGGVAKTTTTLNLAVAFAESGYRVLCIDLDPQGNLTMSQGIDPDKVEKSLYDVLVHDMPISEIIQHREIDIAVASIDLAGAEIAMSTKIGRERSLEKALKEVSGDYDFICIDTPPSLGLLTINALTVATKVIVPVQCEYLSMRGLVQLQNTLKMIQENLNPDVRIEGILPTMLDSRTVHAKEAVEILEENFGDLVFRSRIKKAIKFAEAPVKGASVLKYDPQGNAAGYYRDLAKEVLANESA